MKNIKHTPGPWVVGETIALRHTVLGNGNNSVCKAFGETENESHANAALISAAPEMLEALEAVLWGQASQQGDAKMEALELCREAIAKAKGEK